MVGVGWVVCRKWSGYWGGLEKVVGVVCRSILEKVVCVVGIVGVAMSSLFVCPATLLEHVGLAQMPRIICPVGCVGVAMRGGFVCPATHLEHVGLAQMQHIV